jgi:peptide/nickel transport system permease protein
MANLLLVSFLTLLGNFLADIGYALADPRIRLGQK